MCVKSLFEIRKKDGTLIEDCVTAREAAAVIGCSLACINNSTNSGDWIRHEFQAVKVDRILSRKLDIRLLTDYDHTREELLKRGKRGI